jgi:hypothetical protein
VHTATCPSCGTRVELDFEPVVGLVWCPKCQKMFSQPGSPFKKEKSDPADIKNGQDDVTREHS